MKAKHSVFAAFAAVALIASAAQAQPPAPPAAAAGPRDNPANAPAGAYTVDETHASVIARYLHQGFSYSTFRFTKVSGTLNWDPANAAANKLTASVDTASITAAPAKHPDGSDWVDTVKGERFLKTAQFPKATFTSTKFTKVDNKRAKVEGNLTFMGVTKPVTFDATLIGAGSGMGGKSVVGVSATGKINGTDFGLPAMMFSAPLELQLDVEFAKPAA